MKPIFHWKAQLFVLFNSLFKSSGTDVTLWTIDKSVVWSAKSLGLEANFSHKSFLQIRNNRGPRIKPWGAPALKGLHEKHWTFKTTHHFQFFKKQSKCLVVSHIYHFILIQREALHVMLYRKPWIDWEILTLIFSCHQMSCIFYLLYTTLELSKAYNCFLHILPTAN